MLSHTHLKFDERLAECLDLVTSVSKKLVSGTNNSAMGFLMFFEASNFLGGAALVGFQLEDPLHDLRMIADIAVAVCFCFSASMVSTISFSACSPCSSRAGRYRSSGG